LAGEPALLEQDELRLLDHALDRRAIFLNDARDPVAEGEHFLVGEILAGQDMDGNAQVLGAHPTP
jgi:hypothetical protein